MQSTSLWKEVKANCSIKEKVGDNSGHFKLALVPQENLLEIKKIEEKHQEQAILWLETYPYHQVATLVKLIKLFLYQIFSIIV